MVGAVPAGGWGRQLPRTWPWLPHLQSRHPPTTLHTMPVSDEQRGMGIRCHPQHRLPRANETGTTGRESRNRRGARVSAPERSEALAHVLWALQKSKRMQRRGAYIDHTIVSRFSEIQQITNRVHFV
eukprot:scaffold172844_cov31-Tisochrysis_lutea.AAC.4